MAMDNRDARPERVPPSDLNIEFVKRTDRDGKMYYLAKVKLPITIDLSNAAFFIWDMDDAPHMTVRFGKSAIDPEDVSGV